MQDMEEATAGNRQSDAAVLQQALVDKLKQDGNIHSPPVEAAFRAVPRHLFLPGVPVEQVYRDEAIATKHQDGVAVSSSSQPAIMAIMLEQLGLEPGHRVLEIGAGTGYNAALIAHIVGDAGQVVTVDIDEDIVANAREHLATAGFGQVRVAHGDGGEGYPGGAPFDRIILTVAAAEITPAWREQLAAGGRLVLPLAIRAGVQKSVAFEHVDDHLASVSVRSCGFMGLRGAFAASETRVRLGPGSGLSLAIDGRRSLDAAAVYARLTGAGHDWPTSVYVTRGEIWGGVDLWLALHEPDLCSVWAEGDMADRGVVPCLLGFGWTCKSCFTKGVLKEEHLCLLAPPPSAAPALEQIRNGSPFELFVRDFGGDDALARTLVELTAAWDAAGRPAEKGLRIRAYASDTPYVLAEDEAMVQKRWSRLIFDWQSRQEQATE